MKLKNIDGTEINGMGPDIAADQVSALREKINQLKAGDILVLAGSIPQSMPDTIYMDIMADLQDKGVEIAVDATRDLLMNVLPYRPFLIKPNNHELGEIFGAGRGHPLCEKAAGERREKRPRIHGRRRCCAD